MFAKRWLPLLALLQLSNVAVGQSTHRLRDRRSGVPVPWATVKVLNRPLGAVADGNGLFALTLNTGDTALISSVGYAPRLLTVLPDVIDLEPVARPLDTVRVRQTVALRTVLLGNGVPFLNQRLRSDYPWDSQAGRCYPWGVGGGEEGKFEFAERIGLPDSTHPYRLLRLWLPTRKTDCYGRLLLRFYNVDPLTGAPGEELFVKQVDVNKASVRRARMKIVVDLSADNLLLPPGRAFFLSTGWPPGTTASCFSIIPLFSGPERDTWHRSPATKIYEWTPMVMNRMDISPHQVHALYAAELEERVYK
ncbi:MAG: hypothetical protein EOO12_10755 [Chitinophagaceae bacterium]|nr:MAG: hypothetical protein EOO12_10755 [Chitinophagaceae bacterium]